MRSVLYSLTSSILPNPTPVQPPGTEGFTELLNYGAWTVVFLGLGGFLAAAGYLAFAWLTGREVNAFKGLIIAIIVCVLASGAGAIVQAFV